MLDAASRRGCPYNGRQNAKKIVGPEHDRKDADQEEEAGRDSPGLSEREKAIAAVQTWKSRPPATASGVSGVRE